jgi:hypothetical protein
VYTLHTPEGREGEFYRRKLSWGIITAGLLETWARSFYIDESI